MGQLWSPGGGTGWQQQAELLWLPSTGSARVHVFCASRMQTFRRCADGLQAGYPGPASGYTGALATPIVTRFTRFAHMTSNMRPAGSSWSTAAAAQF